MNHGFPCKAKTSHLFYRFHFTTFSLSNPFFSNSFQIEHQAHGAKTNDPVMNCDNDDLLILKPGQTLSLCNIKSETEVAVFKMTDYQAYLNQK